MTEGVDRDEEFRRIADKRMAYNDKVCGWCVSEACMNLVRVLIRSADVLSSPSHHLTLSPSHPFSL